MNLWRNYWDFILRPVSAEESVPYAQVIPRFYEKVVCSSVFFMAITFVLPPVLKTMFPKWYEALPENKKKELPPYLTSLVHHAVIVPVSWYYLFLDWCRP